MLKFTDSHCHLDFPALHTELDVQLAKCAALGIQRIIVPAVSPQNWQGVLQLTKRQHHDVKLFGCLGLHPWYLTGLDESALQSLEQLVALHQKSLIAIGETGIDGKIALEQNNMRQQQDFFVAQIAMANQYKKPLIVHHRRSHNEVIEILKQQPVHRAGIIHAFSGSYQQGKTYIDLGFKLGIGGTITYERAKKTINAIKRFPKEALVLETDAPAMPLSGLQGEPNRPENIVDIFKHLLAIRTEEKSALAAHLEQNIDQLFFS